MSTGKWRVILELEGVPSSDPSEWSWPIVLEMLDEPHLNLSWVQVSKIEDKKEPEDRPTPRWRWEGC